MPVQFQLVILVVSSTRCHYTEAANAGFPNVVHLAGQKVLVAGVGVVNCWAETAAVSREGLVFAPPAGAIVPRVERSMFRHSSPSNRRGRFTRV